MESLLESKIDFLTEKIKLNYDTVNKALTHFSTAIGSISNSFKSLKEVFTVVKVKLSSIKDTVSTQSQKFESIKDTVYKQCEEFKSLKEEFKLLNNEALGKINELESIKNQFGLMVGELRSINDEWDCQNKSLNDKHDLLMNEIKSSSEKISRQIETIELSILLLRDDIIANNLLLEEGIQNDDDKLTSRL